MVLFAALCVGLAVIVIGIPWPARQASSQWGELTDRGPVVSRGVRRPPLWVRLVPPGLEVAIRRARAMRLEGPDLLARRLVYAGLDGAITPEQFICLRMLVPLGLLGFLLLLYVVDPAPFRLILALVGGAVGVELPNHWLKQKIRQKQEAVRRELPAILTTLGVLLDAGLNLAPALQEVVQRRSGVLSEALGDALRTTALGTPLPHALVEAADRCGVQEFTLFVSVLTQAMEKGASGVSDAVRAQSRQIWALRQQQVQEKGQELSQDLFFILLFLAFPAIALFLLGPVGLSLYETFFAQGQ